MLNPMRLCGDLRSRRRSGDFTADLRNKTLLAPNGRDFPFSFDDSEREALLRGLDDVSATLRYIGDIEAWKSDAKLKRRGCARFCLGACNYCFTP